MSEKLIPNPDGTYPLPEVVSIPLGNLEPGQSYRTQFRDMDELENSIRQFGILTPLWVHPDPEVQNKYIVFAGRRRYEAAKRIARELCDPSLKDSIAAQAGRYLIPCRIFHDLVRIKQALLALTENVVRRDPSPVDTAREFRRIKALYEAEMGRPVKVEQILTMLCGTHVDGRMPGRRHLYRLLRLGELDAGVAAAARDRRLSYGFLDQIARLPEKSEQLELIGLIGDADLSKDDVRDIVNKRLSAKESRLSSIIVEVAFRGQQSSGEKTAASTTPPTIGSGRSKEHNAFGAEGGPQELSLETVEAAAAGGASVIDAAVHKATGLGRVILAEVIAQLRSQADADLLRAADVLEAWAVSEGQRLMPGGDTLKRWLADLTERSHDPDEIERLRVAVERGDYSEIEAELMKLLFMCQGVLPEHLPGYVRQIREAMAESVWYRNLVRCFLELRALLNQVEESKKVNATAKRILDIVFNELFWLATVYDPQLQYHVEKLPPLKKKEFATNGSFVPRVAQTI